MKSNNLEIIAFSSCPYFFPVPIYFKQTKLTSFQRQLNLWGFSRIRRGVYKGAIVSPYFIKGKPEFCHCMTRTKIKGTLPVSRNETIRFSGSPSTTSKPNDCSHGAPSTEALFDVRFPSHDASVLKSSLSYYTPSQSDFPFKPKNSEEELVQIVRAISHPPVRGTLVSLTETTSGSPGTSWVPRVAPPLSCQFTANERNRFGLPTNLGLKACDDPAVAKASSEGASALKLALDQYLVLEITRLQTQVRLLGKLA
jgi:hypothetical protein